MTTPAKTKRTRRTSQAANQAQTSRKDHRPKQDQSYSCGKCDKPAEEETIQCETCGIWFHKKCTNLTNPEFETLIRGNECISFTCEVCLPEKGNLSKRFFEIEKCLKLIQQQTSKIDSFSDILTAVQKQNETIQEQNKIIFKLLETRSDEVIENKIKTQVTEVLDEQVEKDEKRKNIIIFNLEKCDEQGNDTDIVR